MIRFTISTSDELNKWLVRQAKLNHRSKSKQIEHILTRAMREDRGDPDAMCHNEQHKDEKE